MPTDVQLEALRKVTELTLQYRAHRTHLKEHKRARREAAQLVQDVEATIAVLATQIDAEIAKLKA